MKKKFEKKIQEKKNSPGRPNGTFFLPDSDSDAPKSLLIHLFFPFLMSYHLAEGLFLSKTLEYTPYLYLKFIFFTNILFQAQNTPLLFLPRLFPISLDCLHRAVEIHCYYLSLIINTFSIIRYYVLGMT